MVNNSLYRWVIMFAEILGCGTSKLPLPAISVNKACNSFPEIFTLEILATRKKSINHPWFGRVRKCTNKKKTFRQTNVRAKRFKGRATSLHIDGFYMELTKYRVPQFTGQT